MILKQHLAQVAGIAASAVLITACGDARRAASEGSSNAPSPTVAIRATAAVPKPSAGAGSFARDPAGDVSHFAGQAETPGRQFDLTSVRLEVQGASLRVTWESVAPVAAHSTQNELRLVWIDDRQFSLFRRYDNWGGSVGSGGNWRDGFGGDKELVDDPTIEGRMLTYVFPLPAGWRPTPSSRWYAQASDSRGYEDRLPDHGTVNWG